MVVVVVVVVVVFRPSTMSTWWSVSLCSVASWRHIILNVPVHLQLLVLRSPLIDGKVIMSIDRRPTPGPVTDAHASVQPESTGHMPIISCDSCSEVSP